MEYTTAVLLAFQADSGSDLSWEIQTPNYDNLWNRIVIKATTAVCLFAPKS